MTYQPPPYQQQPPFPPQPPYQQGPQPLPYQVPGAYAGGVCCPKCRNPHSSKVGFTWWGGLIGPRMLSHVKCLGCGYQYNGKTGRPNTTGIIIYTLVALGIVIALMAFGAMSNN